MNNGEINAIGCVYIQVVAHITKPTAYRIENES